MAGKGSRTSESRSGRLSPGRSRKATQRYTDGWAGRSNTPRPRKRHQLQNATQQAPPSRTLRPRRRLGPSGALKVLYRNATHPTQRSQSKRTSATV